MEQTNNSYPKFVSGQVLTSDSLNQAFGYLDQQTRLTRANLLGNGILQGLEYTFSNGILTIREGVASTPDGYHIIINGDMSYRVAVKDSALKRHPIDGNEKNDLPPIAYSLFKDTEDAKLHGYLKSQTINITNLNNYIVAIAVDFCAANRKIKCSEVSCDIVQTDHKVEFRPVLIEDSCLNVPLVTKLLPIEGHVRLERFVNIANAINVNVLMRKTGALFEANKEKVVEGIKKIDEFLSNQALQGLLENNNNAIKRLGETYKRISDINTLNEERPDYFFCHLHDLADAINEFVDYYNEFCEKYPYYSINKNTYKQIILLGKGARSSDSDYRQNYTPAIIDNDYLWSCKILKRLYFRIILMSECFINGNIAKMKSLPLKLSWQNPGTPIDKRPIPFYYNVSQDLLNNWAAHRLSRRDASCDYQNITSNGTSHPEIGLNDMLVIQGYYGKNVNIVKSELEKYIKDQDLNIKVLDYPLNKTAVKKKHLETLQKDIFHHSGISKITKYITDNNNVRPVSKDLTIRVPVIAKNRIVNIEEKKISDYNIHELSMMSKKPKQSLRSRILVYDSEAKAFRSRTILKRKSLPSSQRPKNLRVEQMRIIKDYKARIQVHTFLKIAKALKTANEKDVLTRIKNWKELSVDYIKSIIQLFNGITEEQFLNFYCHVFNESAHKYQLAPYSEKHVAAFFAMKSFLERQFDEKLHHAESIEGCRRNSTVVLLHFKGRLIKLISLPS